MVMQQRKYLLVLMNGENKNMTNLYQEPINPAKKTDVILFGAGKIGMKLFPYIIKKYNIRYWIDNNSDLWGKEVCGVEISSTGILPNCNDNIFFTLSESKYPEIEEQLKNYNINPEHFFVAQFSKKEDDVMICPLHQDNFLLNKYELKYYDLLNKNFDKSDVCGIVLFCSFYSSYPLILISNIKKRYKVNITLVTRAVEYKNVLDGLVNHIYCFDTYSDLADILHQLPRCKIFQFLWIENTWAYFYKAIRNACEQLCLFVAGSDFYRAGNVWLNKKENLISVSDGIGMEIESVRTDFLSVYPTAKGKVSIVRYGLDYIENCKHLPVKNEILSKMNITNDKIIVLCGHNAAKENQHKQLIDVLTKLDDKVLKQCLFIFPMTYGDTSGAYIKEITQMLEKTGLNYHVIKDYLSVQEQAELISITDIHIKVQTTDALSSMLLEVMYAGAVVITGSWLPYQPLCAKGIEYETVDSINEVAGVFTNVVNNLDVYKEKSKNNRNIIYNMSSWDIMAKKWMELWHLDAKPILEIQGNE